MQTVTGVRCSRVVLSESASFGTTVSAACERGIMTACVGRAARFFSTERVPHAGRMFGEGGGEFASADGPYSFSAAASGQYFQGCWVGGSGPRTRSRAPDG